MAEEKRRRGREEWVEVHAGKGLKNVRGEEEEGKSGWRFMQGRECGVMCNPMILLYLS